MVDDEEENRNIHLQRFLEDAEKVFLYHKEQQKKKINNTEKTKVVKFPSLGVTRGLFENVILGKTFNREIYSPLHKARLDEDIFGLAINGSDEKEKENPENLMKDTEEVENNFRAESNTSEIEKNKQECEEIPHRNLTSSFDFSPTTDCFKKNDQHFQINCDDVFNCHMDSPQKNEFQKLFYVNQFSSDECTSIIKEKTIPSQPHNFKIHKWMIPKRKSEFNYFPDNIYQDTKADFEITNSTDLITMLNLRYKRKRKRLSPKTY